ncbi:MAG: radical SAM family heme chaperone HemW [Bacteroidetes bacterium]|nr:radical SAM family heme chaperone HemW [Bacteroidota bacterium]
MAGIYIHIPFCEKACHYCNFFFTTNKSNVNALVGAIQKEIKLAKYYTNETIRSIYFGGGTPSLLLTSDIHAISQSITNNFDVQLEEFTLEANPDDISESTLTEWRRSGVNRLSIGVQSFHDDDLQWMNRSHNASQALEAIHLAKQNGIENISLDLIFSYPQLTKQKLIDNLKIIKDLNVPHVSIYGMTVEPNTVLSNWIDTGKTKMPDQDNYAEHYNIIIDTMTGFGFEHYEISSFAKPGFRAFHNSNYWSGTTYIGIGPSAHSFNGDSRQWNINNLGKYIEAINDDQIPFTREELNEEMKLNEYLMLSLRTSEGCDLNVLSSKFRIKEDSFVINKLNEFQKKGYLERETSHFFLANQSKAIADSLISELFTEQETISDK